MITARTILREALCQLGREIARACQWRRDGAVIARGRRGLSPVIPALLALLAFVGAVRDAEAAFANGYSYRRLIDPTNAQVSGGPHTNFPMLVSVTLADLRTTANGGKVTDAQGDDIIFTDSDGTTQLAHEIETYVATTGELVAWVRVPSLAATSTLYLYYGNSAVTTFQGNVTSNGVTGVWDANFLGVWHLKENPAGSAPQMKDSTSNVKHGTSFGSMTSGNQVAGKVNGSLTFDGTDDRIQVGTVVGDRNAFTIALWFKHTSTGAPQKMYGEGNTGTNTPIINISSNEPATGDVQFEIRDDAGAVGSVVKTGGNNDGAWHHLVAVQSSKSSRTLYVDGVSQGTNTTTIGAITLNTGNIAVINRVAVQFFYPGSVDEARISNVARSAGWILTEYNNQSSPAGFVTVGPESSGVNFDAAANSPDLSNLTSGSWSHTTSGTNRYLVVGLSGWDSVDPLTSVTVTYAGVAMTKLGGIEGGNNNTAILWGLVNPALGTNTVQVSNIPAGYNQLGGGSVSFTGVHQTAPTGTLASTPYPTTGTVNITLANGDLGVDIVYSGGNPVGTPPVAGAGETARTSQTSGGGTTYHRMGTEAGTGTVTMNWTGGSTTDNGIAAIPIKAASAASATLSSAANQTFTVGQAAATASTLTVTDASTPAITATNDLRIRIPAGLNMVWDTSVTTITPGGGASGKVSATGVTYEDSNKTAVINVTTDFAASDALTIAGLKFMSFTATSSATSLQLVVAGSGGATASTDDKTITINAAAPVASTGAGAVASALSGNVTPGLPTGWQPGDLHIAIINTGDTNSSTMPAGWTLITTSPAQPANLACGSDTCRHTLFYRFAVAGDTAPLITHGGSNPIIARIIGFSGVDTTTPFDVTPSFTSSGSDQTVEAAAITTVTPNTMLVFVAFMGEDVAEVGGNLPTGTPWTKAFYNAQGFTPGRDLAIAAFYGLRSASGSQQALQYTFGTEPIESRGAQIALRPLAGGAAATLSSAANQTFTVGQAAATASTLTVTDASTPAITATNDLRIRIPAGLNMVWDTSVTTITPGGGASGKVSATGVTYEDSNKTAVINVTTNFAVSEQVTIAGLKFMSFTATSSATSLQLVVAGSGGATAATDDKTITIGAAAPITTQQTISGCAAPGAGAIAFVASANAGITALGNLTINKPTGTVQDHVMVASISFRITQQNQTSIDIGITAPSGWTLVRRIDNANSSSNGLAIYRKVAGASEPSSYAWTFACINASGNNTCVTEGFNAATGGILSFSGVDTTTLVDVENGSSTTSSNATPATPSVTTTVANTMLVTSHVISNENTWANPPTSGMTQAFQSTFGTLMIQVSYAAQAAAGATGTKTATDNLDVVGADNGNAHILALRPGSAAPTSLVLPSWTPQSGELLLVGVSMRDETISHSVSGNGLTWTLVADRDNDRGQMGVALYRASGTSPTTGSITITLTGNTLPAYAVAVRLANVDTAVSQGIEAVATASGPAGADDANMKVTVTTVTANAMALAWGGQRGSATLSLPAGESVIDQSSSDCGTSGDRVRGHMWQETVATPGATQLGQDNSLSTANPWAVIGVSIKPQAGALPTPSTLSSAASQTFAVGQASTAALTLTVTDASTPTITAAQELRIRIPAGLNMIWDTSVTTATLGGGAAGKVSATGITYEASNKTAVLNVTTNFAASDVLTIAGLRFTSFTAVSAATSLQLVVAGAGGATAATDDKTLRIVAVGLLSSAANQTFTVGQGSTTASTITVTDSSTPTITDSQNLRIRIPAALNMVWDTSVTTVTLGGGAAGKVSASGLTYEDSNKTVRINVTSDFSGSDQVTIAGLKFMSFTAASTGNLQLVVAGSGGATAAIDDKTITITGPGIVSQQTISGCAAPSGGSIAFVAAAQAGITALGNLTINKPTGTVQNHVMVASIGFRVNSPGQYSTDVAVAAPSGWTLVRRIDNLGSTGSGLAIYRKVAGASEPSSYAWGFTCTNVSGGDTCNSLGFNAAVGGIVSFSGVDTTTPIDVENGATSGETATQSTPSVTTTVANTMLVTSHSIANDNTWANPPPSGMTQAFQQTNGGQMTQVSYAAQAAAGATGTKAATDNLNSSGADDGNAHILALRPGAGSATSLTLPSWTPLAGELLLVGISMRDETISHSVSGNGLTWTLVADRDNDWGQMGVALYRASGASPTAGSITITLTGNTLPAYAVAVRLANVDTAVNQGIEAVATASGPSGSNNNDMKVTVTTLTANAKALAWGGQQGSATLTLPAEESMIAESSADCGTSPDQVRGHMWQQVVPTPGATQLGQDNDLSSSRPWAAIGVSIKPVPPTPPQAPGRFNAYESTTVSGAPTGVIRTKQAGADMSLDIVALNSARTAIDTAFTGTVRVEVLDASNNSAGLDGNGCRSSWTVFSSGDVTFVSGENGRKTVSGLNYANSYPNVRVRIYYPTSSPTLIGCSNDNFAIRPAALVNFAASDGDWQTAGTTRTLASSSFATVVHKAGRPMSVRASAVNATGTTVTSNYTGAPAKWVSACAGAACTPSFGTLTLATTFAAGQLSTDVASYNNVGSLALQLVDTTYASVDVNDTVGDCSASGSYTCTATVDVGRFVPDHFAVSLNTPSITTGCSGFTYVGQKLNYATAPVITVTAQDFANNTTTLYNTINSWWRITSASLTGKAYTTLAGTLDTSGVPGTDPVIAASGSGTGTLTFSSGTGLLFARTTPVAPFDAELSLAINVVDADGVTYASNPARFGQATAGNGIAFSGGKGMRFGRFTIGNANGSQLVPLLVRVEAQYWSGPPSNAFITNTVDSCTSVAPANYAMGSYTGNLSGSPTCETAISGGTLSSGRGTLLLATPGAGNDGSVTLTANLGATASGSTCTTQGAAPISATTANLPHLQGNWTGSAYDVNPSARASFGVFRGSDEVIYMRENF